MREREITVSSYSCFFGYSLGPNIVDPILTLVLPISIWKGKKYLSTGAWIQLIKSKRNQLVEKSKSLSNSNKDFSNVFINY